jgi:hypothetical protein
MRPYGLSRLLSGDVDVDGCNVNGRPSEVYNLKGPGGDARASRGLRGARKAARRRPAKRAARREGAAACAEG